MLQEVENSLLKLMEEELLMLSDGETLGVDDVMELRLPVERVTETELLAVPDGELVGIDDDSMCDALMLERDEGAGLEAG